MSSKLWSKGVAQMNPEEEDYFRAEQELTREEREVEKSAKRGINAIQ